MRHTLKKSEIIRGKRIFDEIFERGVRVRSTIIQAIVLPEPVKPVPRTLPGSSGSPADGGQPGPPVRMAAVVPKASGTAAARNRFKRLIRESYRHDKGILLSSGRPIDGTLNIVFLWSPRVRLPAREVTLTAVRDDVAGLLNKIRDQFT